MLKKVITVGIGIFFAINLCAEFSDDFKSSTELYNKKEYTKAQEAFMKLAESAPTPKSKSECLAYTASCLSRQKQYDQAIELARKIEVKPISINCQMEIMLESGKQKELINAFKDEDISSWPDFIIHKGFYNRANAYRAMRDDEVMLKDLEKALETSDTSGWFQVRVLNDIGNAYMRLNQDGKALEYHRRVVNAPGFRGQLYTFSDSVIAASGILVKQGKYDKALLELNKFDPLPPSGIWKILALEICGDIYAGQGKKDEAIAKYREALKVENQAAGPADRINKKISTITEKQGVP